MSYSIKFEKAKDYKRFNLHNVISDVNRFGDFTIEFFEDIDQMVEGIYYDEEDNEPVYINPDSNVVRTIHAGATLHVQRIPQIIQALQERLDAYNNYNKSNQGDADGEK
jgi:hypothetical protein